MTCNNCKNCRIERKLKQAGWYGFLIIVSLVAALGICVLFNMPAKGLVYVIITTSAGEGIILLGLIVNIFAGQCSQPSLSATSPDAS